METAAMIFEFLGLIIKDVKEWFDGGDSTIDYSEFAKRAGGKFKSELLLEREKNRVRKSKKPS